MDSASSCSPLACRLPCPSFVHDRGCGRSQARGRAPSYRHPDSFAVPKSPLPRRSLRRMRSRTSRTRTRRWIRRLPLVGGRCSRLGGSCQRYAGIDIRGEHGAPTFGCLPSQALIIHHVVGPLYGPPSRRVCSAQSQDGRGRCFRFCLCWRLCSGGLSLACAAGWLLCCSLCHRVVCLCSSRDDSGRL